MHFCQPWTRTCMPHSQKSAPVEVIHCHCLQYWNAPPIASLWLHPLFALYQHSANISECQLVPFFSTWRNSVTYLFFIRTSMSDAILSDWLNCCCCLLYGKKCNKILAARFNLYFHTAIHPPLWVNIMKQEALLLERPLYFQWLQAGHSRREPDPFSWIDPSKRVVTPLVLPWWGMQD